MIVDHETILTAERKRAELETARARCEAETARTGIVPRELLAGIEAELDDIQAFIDNVW